VSKVRDELQDYLDTLLVKAIAFATLAVAVYAAMKLKVGEKIIEEIKSIEKLWNGD